MQPFKWSLLEATFRARPRATAWGTLCDLGRATNLQTEAKEPARPEEYPGHPLQSTAYQLLLASGLTSSQAQEYTVVGNLKKAFKCRYVYKLQTIEAPPQNPEEFTSDAVSSSRSRVPSSRRPGVADPQFAALAYNT